MPWLRNFVQLSSTITRQSPLCKSPALSVPQLYLTQLVRHVSFDSSRSYAGLGPTKGDEKPRVVVLGSGWAGCMLIQDIVVAAHSSSGPWRSPLRGSKPAISREPGSYFFFANSTGVDFQEHQVYCQSITDGTHTLDMRNFSISYDKLVIASGAEASTFGIVQENMRFFSVKFIMLKK